MLSQWINSQRRIAFESNVSREFEVSAERLFPASGAKTVRVQQRSANQPISNAIVRLTLIGPDGGDGGFQSFATDKDGFLRLHHPILSGRYQFDVILPPTNPDRFKAWTRDLGYLMVSAGSPTSSNFRPKVLSVE